MTHRRIRCRSCQREIIFLPTLTGRRMPVDADSVEETDDFFDYKKHVSHFATCDQPGKFRRPRE